MNNGVDEWASIRKRWRNKRLTAVGRYQRARDGLRSTGFGSFGGSGRESPPDDAVRSGDAGDSGTKGVELKRGVSTMAEGGFNRKNLFETGRQSFASKALHRHYGAATILRNEFKSAGPQFRSEMRYKLPPSGRGRSPTEGKGRVITEKLFRAA